jgi:hypothetical protein
MKSKGKNLFISEIWKIKKVTNAPIYIIPIYALNKAYGFKAKVYLFAQS